MEFFSRITAILRTRQDLALVALLMTTIAVMIIPLPPGLLDMLIAVNISLTVLILIVSIYLDRPTSFSTFPAVILVATTFRLAISISTTRSVLITADGGDIVRTFGTFVTGGNIAVGLVIFLIITVVQFLVITKGAERVAEVSARFTLDALPGRQMSIDAEVRAGDIDAVEARRRRRLLDKENQFFGAMDGAMKFVKGDAIAGLLIVAINLLGGIVVGVVQNGMNIQTAGHTYSLLTIGDGLVAQIPALLIALCAGTVITRVTAEDSGDLGSNIVNEILTDPRVMTVAGVIVLTLGFVPGFPTIVFLILGASLISSSFFMKKRAVAEALAVTAATQQDDPMGENFAVSATDRVLIRTGTNLSSRLESAQFSQARYDMLERLEKRYGFKLPLFGYYPDPSTADDGFVVIFDQVPIFRAVLPADMFMARANEDMLTIAGIESMAAGDLWPDNTARLVAKKYEKNLQDAHIAFWDTPQILVETVERLLEQQLSAFIGFNTLQSLMQEVREESPDLVDQVTQSVPRAKILDVLRRLTSEQVPITPARRVFEGLSDAGQRESDAGVLAEHCRSWLRNQICYQYADESRVVSGYIIEPDLEHALRSTLKQTETGSFLILSASASNMVLSQIANIPKPTDPNAPECIILTSGDLRRYFKQYLLTHNINFQVLAFHEISTDFRFQPIGTLALQGFDATEAANAA